MREQGYSYIREEDEDIEKYLNSKRNAYYEYNPEQLEKLERERDAYNKKYGNNGNAIVENSWQKPVTVTGGLFTFFFTVLTITLAALASPLLVPLAITTLVVGAAATVAVGVSSYDKSRLEKKDNDRTIKRALAKDIKNAETQEQTQAREAKQAAAKQRISPSYPPSVAVPWAASNGNPKAFKSPGQVSDYSRKLTPKELKAKMNVFNKKHIRGYEGAVLKDFYSEIASARAERGAPISLDSLRRTLFCKEKDGRLVNSTLNGGGLNIKNMTPAQRMQVFEIVVNAGNLDDHIVRAGLQKEIASRFEQDSYYGVGYGNKEAVFKMEKAEVTARVKICDQLLEAEKTLIQARKDLRKATGLEKTALEQLVERETIKIELKKAEMDGRDPNYSGYKSYRDDPKATAKKLKEELSEINKGEKVVAMAALTSRFCDLAKSASGDEGYVQRAFDHVFPRGSNVALNEAVNSVLLGDNSKKIVLAMNVVKQAMKASASVANTDSNQTVEILLRAMLKANGQQDLTNAQMKAIVGLSAADGKEDNKIKNAVKGTKKLSEEQVVVIRETFELDSFKKIKDGVADKSEMRKLVVEAMFESLATLNIHKDVKDLLLLAIAGESKKAQLESRAKGLQNSDDIAVKAAANMVMAQIGSKIDGAFASKIIAAAVMGESIESGFGEKSASAIIGVAHSLKEGQKGVSSAASEKDKLGSYIKSLAGIQKHNMPAIISNIGKKLNIGNKASVLSAMEKSINAARDAEEAMISINKTTQAVDEFRDDLGVRDGTRDKEGFKIAIKYIDQLCGREAWKEGSLDYFAERMRLFLVPPAIFPENENKFWTRSADDVSSTEGFWTMMRKKTELANKDVHDAEVRLEEAKGIELAAIQSLEKARIALSVATDLYNRFRSDMAKFRTDRSVEEETRRLEVEKGKFAILVPQAERALAEAKRKIPDAEKELKEAQDIEKEMMVVEEVAKNLFGNNDAGLAAIIEDKKITKENLAKTILGATTNLKAGVINVAAVAATNGNIKDLSGPEDASEIDAEALAVDPDAKAAALKESNVLDRVMAAVQSPSKVANEQLRHVLGGDADSIEEASAALAYAGGFQHITGSANRRRMDARSPSVSDAAEILHELINEFGDKGRKEAELASELESNINKKNAKGAASTLEKMSKAGYGDDAEELEEAIEDAMPGSFAKRIKMEREKAAKKAREHSPEENDRG